jgi:TonB family protein
MSTVTLFAFNFLLNALWQIPLVFCAAWLAARLARPSGPKWEHRIWVTSLFAALLLPLFRLNLQQVDAFVLALFAPAAPTTADASVSVFTGPTSVAASAWQISPLLITLVLATWAAAILYFTGRLLWTIHRTSILRRNAHTIDPSEFPILHKLLRDHPHSPQFLVSQSVSGPAIIGILRPALLLPPGFLDRTATADIHAAIAHELAHLRRRDYAKNLFYEVLTLPIAWHPVAWLTRARIAESREILCDHLAAHAALGPQDYARALLRLASQQSIRKPQTVHAIGIFDTQSLERRIMQLTQLQIRATPTRRLLILAACAALAITTGASALALHVDAATASGHATQTSSKRVHVSPKVMQVHKIAGKSPVYPLEAKKKHIQGTVVLLAWISKDGKMQDLRVLSGPRILGTSALEAVRTWRYTPYILNGKPVAVSTTINVIYSLEGGPPSKSSITAAIQQQLAEAQAQLAAARASLNSKKLNRSQIQKQMAEAQQRVQKAQEALNGAPPPPPPTH